MQCPSCSFQNMPGSGNCARCGAMLALASIAIDVHPPRASALGRSMFGFWRFPASGDISSGICCPRKFPGRRSTEMPRISSFPRFCVPWCRAGRISMWASAASDGFTWQGTFACATIGTFADGHTVWRHSAGTRICHSCGIHRHGIGAKIRFFWQSIDFHRSLRLAAGAICLSSRRVITFADCRTAIDQWECRLRFDAGDVVWYRPTSHVEAGQYVLYDSADTMQGRRYIRAGMRINRVIAVAGQTLTWEDGKLFVDGKLARRSCRLIAKPCFRSWKFLPNRFLWIRRILAPGQSGTLAPPGPECQ